jgi:23S rRNA (adenine-N6)-dimethyltransferase
MVYHQKDSLSQNFIKYRRVVCELIEVSDLKENDTVVEIGSGKGIITEALRQRVKKVIAVEKDENLAIESNAINIDFLKFELPKTPYKIFSNIPFSITSEIMTHILTSQILPDTMYLIMQKEVADKFEGIPVETMSSILAKPWYEIETLGEIDRTTFTQKPQVKIVFVKFSKRENPFVKNEFKNDYRDFVTYGFSQWKPTVIESYKKIFTFAQLDHIKKMLKISNEKPGQLSFDKWLILFKTYQKIANEQQKNTVSLG